VSLNEKDDDLKDPLDLATSVKVLLIVPLSCQPDYLKLFCTLDSLWL
jgi:hypothetical protein